MRLYINSLIGREGKDKRTHGGLTPAIQREVSYMKQLLLEADLRLFGEGGEGASSGSEGAAAAEAPASPVRAGKKAGAYDNVIFGRQETAETETSDAGENEQNKNEPDPKARENAWNDLIKGEYKDLYDRNVQRIINSRFKETKSLQENLDKQRPVLDMLLTKYNISNNDMDALTRAIEQDDSYWADLADAAGMSVSQYKDFNRMRVENQKLQEFQKRQQQEQAVRQQVASWQQEADSLKQEFPSLDLNAEIQNPEFARLLQANVGVRTAYMAVHSNEIVSQAMAQSAKKAEERVVNNIRANGQRPTENGSSKQSAFVYKSDVNKLTKEDRREAVRRAARGEIISW